MMLEEHRPDLVLLDVLMPGMDGFETCRQIRMLPVVGDTPVLFLTALGDLGTHKQALDSGADDFLTKPINRTELLIRVRSLLRIKQLSDELKRNYDVIRAQHDCAAGREPPERGADGAHRPRSEEPAVQHPVERAVRPLPQAAGHRGVRVAGRRRARVAVDGPLVMNLLDVSRSEDGALIPHVTEFDLTTLLRRCARRWGGAWRTRIRSCGHLRGGGGAGARRSRSDPAVLENLIDNAYKYGPRQTTISIEILAATMDDGADRPSRFACATRARACRCRTGSSSSKSTAAWRGGRAAARGSMAWAWCSAGAPWAFTAARSGSRTARAGRLLLRSVAHRALAAVRGRRLPGRVGGSRLGEAWRVWPRSAAQTQPAGRRDARHAPAAGGVPPGGLGASPTGCFSGCCSVQAVRRDRDGAEDVTAALGRPGWRPVARLEGARARHRHLGASAAGGVFAPRRGFHAPRDRRRQGLMTSLLIHVAGGRPEMHYAIFVMLPFLSLYRDVSVLVLASTITVRRPRAGCLPVAAFGVRASAVSRSSGLPASG
jgi:DNA-binding response OmpR family regulator